MQNYRADFILEYNDRSLGSNALKRIDIDWSQSRVLFVAPQFTERQQYAIGFKNIRIQLWEIHKYENGIVTFNEVRSPAIVRTNPIAKRVSEEVHTEDHHLSAVDDNVKELYMDLKSAIISLGKDIEVRPTIKYISFRRRKGVAGIIFLKYKLKAYLHIDYSDIKDPKKYARDVAELGHHARGNTEVTITERGKIPYILTLIKQAYEKS